MLKQLLLGLCLAAIGSTAAQGAGSATPDARVGGVYRAPLAGEPTTFDPALYSDIYTMQVANTIFDGLVTFDDKLGIAPAIAKRWKVSRDRRTYTFVLREGVRFHNGREVTAEDVVFSFSRLLDPQLDSPAAALFLNIEGADAFRDGASPIVSGLEALDRYVVKIALKKPFAPFLSILAMANAKVIPQEALGPTFATRPVGTGPFKFVDWEHGSTLTLEANTDYFAGRPFLDRLQFRIYPNIDWQRIYNDFQNNRLEHTVIPRDRYDSFAYHEAMITQPGLNIVYLGINQDIAPLGDVRVRQAINYAIDTAHIVNTISKRGSKPAAGILPPGIPGYDPQFQGYGYDPQRARELLAEAGFANGEGLPVIQFWTVSKADVVRQQLDAIQQYLGAVGLRTDIHVAENWSAFVEAINDNRAGLYYAAWYGDYPDPDNFLYTLAHSDSRVNRMGFSDPQVDRLLQQARTETEFVERARLYRVIERQVVDQAPIVSLHVNANSLLFRAGVEGVRLSQLGEVYLPFRLLWLNPAARSASAAAGD